MAEQFNVDLHRANLWRDVLINKMVLYTMDEAVKMADQALAAFDKTLQVSDADVAVPTEVNEVSWGEETLGFLKENFVEHAIDLINENTMLDRESALRVATKVSRILSNTDKPWTIVLSPAELRIFYHIYSFND